MISDLKLHIKLKLQFVKLLPHTQSFNLQIIINEHRCPSIPRKIMAQNMIYEKKIDKEKKTKNNNKGKNWQE
jgi:hypothetical protein